MKRLHHASGGSARVSLLSSWLEVWMSNSTGLLSKENRQEIMMQMDVTSIFTSLALFITQQL